MDTPKKDKVVPMADLRRIRNHLLEHDDAPKYVRRFLHLTSVLTKVDYIDYILAHLEVFQRMLLVHRNRKPKNRSSTFQLLKNGKKSYTYSTEKFDSMASFNKAIANAEIGSEQMALAYSQRSSVYYEWRMYEESIRNIRLARECQLSESLREELRIREKTCKKFMRLKRLSGQGSSAEVTSDDSSDENGVRLDVQLPDDEYVDPRDMLKWSSEEEDDIPPVYPFNVEDIETKLSFDPNPSFPLIAAVIDVKKVKDNDWKLYSKTNLKMGDVIALEDAFSCYVPAKGMLHQCSACMDLLVAPIPCKKCTRVLFCTQECHDRAMRTFHKYECPVIDTLLRILDDVHMATVRVALTALCLFPNLIECKEFCKNPQNKKEVFDLNFNDLDKIEYYKAILNWKKHPAKDSVVDTIQVCLLTCTVRRILYMNTDLREEIGRDAKFHFLGELLYQHFETCPPQIDTITAYLDHHNGKKTVEFGGHGTYGLRPLMKDSEPTTSNISKVYRATKCLYVVNRPIPANTPLIQTKSAYFLAEDERMPPSFNSTTMFDMLESSDVPEKLNRLDVAPILNGDRDFARLQYRCYAEYLWKNKEFYKTYQMRLMEKTFFMTLSILGEAVPLESLPSPDIDEAIEL